MKTHAQARTQVGHTPVRQEMKCTDSCFAVTANALCSRALVQGYVTGFSGSCGTGKDVTADDLAALTDERSLRAKVVRYALRRALLLVVEDKPVSVTAHDARRKQD